MGLLAPLDEAIPELRVPNGLPQEVGSAVVAAWANSAEREGFEPSGGRICKRFRGETPKIPPQNSVGEAGIETGLS